MNKDQGDGAVKDKAGKAQQRARKAADSSQHAKDVAKQIGAARLQNASENVKAALRNSGHS